MSVGGLQILGYSYDDLGQLIREDNRELNKTYTWTYDNAGNILEKKTYAFTLGSLPATALATDSYLYQDANWGDLLTSYNNQTITYDEIGNPLTLNGFTLEWEGRRLIGMSMNAGQFGYEFEYNADGIRTMKRSLGGTAHVYGLNGSQILSETIGNKLLVYLYDESGAPIGLQYRTTIYAAGQYDTYFFEKNLQGDIIAVYTENGVKIGSYNYDAWGVCSYSYSSGATTAQKQIVSTLNPFRYRGYYYDTETGLYYLNSRYYNPQWGRFLNADAYLSTGTGMIGYNMYTYCNNNSVNELDTTGTWPRWITETVVAVAIVVCLGATLSGNVPLATAAWKVGAVATGVLIAQTVHYDVRENLNQINGGVPEKEPSKEKILTEGIDPGVAADCHQITAEEGYPNKKYCWPDGREAIYNSSEDLVTDSRDVGTYNFFVPTSPGRKILHGVFDVFPWVFLGNNDDWGPIVNYPVKFLKGVFS